MTTSHTPGELKLTKANARRLVAAWSACDGIDTEDLEAGSVSIIAKLHDDAAKRLLAQRDELLEALKGITEILDDEVKAATDAELADGLSDPQCLDHVKKALACVIRCRAAIAKAEGGAA